MVYDFKFLELQAVLDAVKQNKSGSKQCLRKRVLNMLSGSSSKTKVLRQKIIQIHKARGLQRQQNLSSQYSIQPIPPLHPQQNFLQRFLLQPSMHNSTPYSQEPYHELPQPNIDFENLPFYKTIDTLLKPMCCQSGDIDIANFTGLFYLQDNIRHTIVKSWDISRQQYKVQIILRLVKVGLVDNVTTDRLPYNIAVSVNDHSCKLPVLNIPTKAGITPWRCNVPIDITQQTDLKNCLQNTLRITWSDDPQEYMAGVFLSQKLTWQDLLKELQKRPVREPEKTKEFIKKSMESDIDMGVDSMFATVKDPLSKTKMELPARGKACIHLQCFDAKQFLQMNEQKQTWLCPLCKKKVNFEDIQVDGFFLDILQSPTLSEDCENVILKSDGSWSEKKIKQFSKNSKVSACQSTSNNIEVFTLSDSDDDVMPLVKRSKRNPPKIEKELKIKSEHIVETINLDGTNSLSENDLVLDLSVKNNSLPSTSSVFQPITLNDEPDQSLMEPSFLLNNIRFLPNITITESNNRDFKPSTSISENNRRQSKDKSRNVLYTITLD